MKIKKIFLLTILAIFCSTVLFAQLKETYKPKENKRTIEDPIAGDWSFGAGFNIVDDGGKILGGLFEGKKYNHFHMPLTVNAEYFYNSQFSFTGTISLNKYTEGKYVDRRGTILKDEEPGFLAFDVGTKFYFRDIFNDYVFEPYVFTGLGYTSLGSHVMNAQTYYDKPENVTLLPDGQWDVPTVGTVSFNFGLGTNFWITKTWGVNINAAGKWAFKGDKYKEIRTNYTQFTFGAFYCLKKK